MNFMAHKSAIDFLQMAIEDNDKSRVSSAYDRAIELDWENAPDELYNEYDNLIEQGNEIILNENPIDMSTETLDITKLSANDKAQLMAQLEAAAKAEKQKKKDDRKAYKDLTFEFVNRNIEPLLNHNDVTGNIIENLFKDYEPIKDLKQEVYGSDPQDSHTSTLPDGSASITIGHNVSIRFDGTESSGANKIREFITSLSDDSSDDKTKKLAKSVDTFLKLNPKTGQLNPSKIIELSNLREEFDDERFNDGLDIIFKAQIRAKTSMYVSGWKVLNIDNKPKKLTFRFSV